MVIFAQDLARDLGLPSVSWWSSLYYFSRLRRKAVKIQIPLAIRSLGLLLALASGAVASAQSSRLNPIPTAIPSLRISPDARGASLGDIGVATGADAYAQYWNAAKYSFALEPQGVALAYTPWLTKLVSDIALMQLAGYVQLDAARRHSLGASLRYFNIGEVVLWNAEGAEIDLVNPREYALDLSYSYRLLPTLSAALTLRYIHSDYDMSVRRAASALSGDLGLYMQRSVHLVGRSGQWMAGLALKNLGDKVSYDLGKTYHFLPTSLSLGSGLSLDLAPEHRLLASFELSKLLVPTPPLPSRELNALEWEDLRRAYHSTSPIEALVSSWSDAPGGLAEELREVRWGLGVEYSYLDRFFGRLGYSYLHPDKGDIESLNFGVGFKARAFTIDVAYLASLGKYSPLDRTFRFSLTISIDGIQAMLKQ